jgi:hypothetical protein
LYFSKVRVGFLEMLVPGSKLREHFGLMEDHRPSEGTGKHVFDEATGREPSHVRVANLISSQVGADHIVFEPRKLLVDLLNFGGTVISLETSGSGNPLGLIGREVHSSLGVRVSLLSTVRRCNI